MPAPATPRAVRGSAVAALRADLVTALEHRRLLVLILFALIGGLISYALLPLEPQRWALLGVWVVLAVGVALSRAALGRLRVLVLGLAAWSGLCLLPVHGALWGTPMLERPVYGGFTARVDLVLSEDDRARRVIVSDLVADEPGREPAIRRARLFMPPEPPLAPGDRLHAMLRLAPVPGPVLPGGYDGQFASYYDGIGAYGTVTSGLERVSEETDFNSDRWISGLRRTIGARLEAVLDQPASGIGWAMIAGDQSDITDETREVMAASGLAHVYSISGLHLSLVAGGSYFVLRLLLALSPLLGQRMPVKKLAAGGGIVVALAYLMLAGGIGNVPALRSTLMLALIYGAVLAGRRALTMRNVAIAALVIILIDPAGVFRPSFQLSFAAVVALIGTYELMRGRTGPAPGLVSRLVRAVGAVALTSLIAGTATLLFSAYHFQQTAPLSVVGNVLAMPFVSLIMASALVSVLAMPFGVEGPFVLVLGWGIDRMLNVAHLVAGWSEGLIGNPLLTGTALVIGLVALGWFAFLRSAWRFAGPMLAIPAVLAFGLDQRPDVLVADTTQAVALRGQEGYGLVTGRPGSFAVDVWSEHFQQAIAPSVPGQACDALGCLATGPDGIVVAVVKAPEAFWEDCAHADLVITRLTAPRTCRDQTTVIDAGDLAQGGVHWLRWQPATRDFEVRAAIPPAARPWRAGGQ